MKKLLLFSLLLLGVFFFSFKKPTGYVISGNLTGFENGSWFYLKNLNTDEILDSARIAGNKFLMRGQLYDAPEQLWLYTQHGKEFIYTNLLIGNEKIIVSGDKKDFPADLQITGSKIQDGLNELQNLTKKLTSQRNELVQNHFSLTEKDRKNAQVEFSSQLKKIDAARDSITIIYIKNNPGRFTSAINLAYMKNTLPKDTLRVLYNAFSPQVKSSKYARLTEVHLKGKNVEKGDKFHDFEATDQSGKTVKFSELGGKYILLDFTAAFCGPCIIAADELRIINKDFSDSLKIVSFSGDPKKEVWLKSLERDKVSWVSLWDGKGRFSETAIKYGVNGFPTFFLIDPRGEVIEIWSGYGKGMLQDKLKRFKNS